MIYDEVSKDPRDILPERNFKKLPTSNSLYDCNLRAIIENKLRQMK